MAYSPTDTSIYWENNKERLQNYFGNKNSFYYFVGRYLKKNLDDTENCFKNIVEIRTKQLNRKKASYNKVFYE